MEHVDDDVVHLVIEGAVVSLLGHRDNVGGLPELEPSRGVGAVLPAALHMPGAAWCLCCPSSGLIHTDLGELPGCYVDSHNF